MGRKHSKTRRRLTAGTYAAIALGIALVILLWAYLGLNHNDNGVEGTLEVHFIDVGQGDAILIKSPQGGFMLIDAGESSEYGRLSAYLDAQKVTALEYAVFTHPHSDHIGGGAKIVENYPVGLLIMPDAVHTSKAYENLIDAALAAGIEASLPRFGDKYNFGGAAIQILAPNGEEYSNLNNYSVVIRLTFGDTAFVFAGDAEKLSEKEILSAAADAGLDLRCDVLKAGHHGSSTSTGEAFLDALRPGAAVITCAAGNSYGHPNKALLDLLSARGIKVYRTDIDGTIVMRSDGKQITVSTRK